MCALAGSNVFIIAIISPSVRYEKAGNMLAFFIGVHIDAKKLLKMLAFL